jgi:hypothetical protein
MEQGLTLSPSHGRLLRLPNRVAIRVQARTSRPARSGKMERNEAIDNGSRRVCVNGRLWQQRQQSVTDCAFWWFWPSRTNHQGLANELIVRLAPSRDAGTVRRAQRLGGLLNFYHRAA